ncbi:MAG: hypothetical protein AAF368_08810, partial [Planctomycetota bacterium]
MDSRASVYSERRRWILLACIAAGLLTACAAEVPEELGEQVEAPEWNALPAGAVEDQRLHGVWENPATGHTASFSRDGVEVFHVLDDFCIRDTGVVPKFSLYRFGERRDELWLHHYDFRDRPELLQSARVFRKRSELPEACSRDAVARSYGPPEVFGLIVRAF